MKISTSSWHYRMIQKFARISSPSRSLCVYFWQMIWALVCTTIVSLCAAATALGLVLFPLDAFGILGISTFAASLGGWLGSLTLLPLAAGLLAWVCIGGIALVFLCIGMIEGSKKVSRYISSKRSLHGRPKDDNLVVSYLKAKKQKVCPVIDFTK